MDTLKRVCKLRKWDKIILSGLGIFFTLIGILCATGIMSIFII